MTTSFWKIFYAIMSCFNYINANSISDNKTIKREDGKLKKCVWVGDDRKSDVNFATSSFFWQLTIIPDFHMCSFFNLDFFLYHKLNTNFVNKNIYFETENSLWFWKYIYRERMSSSYFTSLVLSISFLL